MHKPMNRIRRTKNKHIGTIEHKSMREVTIRVQQVKVKGKQVESVLQLTQVSKKNMQARGQGSNQTGVYSTLSTRAGYHTVYNRQNIDHTLYTIYINLWPKESKSNEKSFPSWRKEGTRRGRWELYQVGIMFS